MIQSGLYMKFINEWKSIHCCEVKQSDNNDDNLYDMYRRKPQTFQKIHSCNVLNVTQNHKTTFLRKKSCLVQNGIIENHMIF
jgi:hypothetical protein